MGKKQPAPTPPREVAAAQTGTNVSTAIANSYLGNINEIGPDGSTRVERTGMESVFDPYTGISRDIPTFTRTTELSPEQQAIKEQQDAAGLNLATLGNDLSGTLGHQLTGNFELGNEETEARLFELGRGRLDPMFGDRRADLETQLSNQGIKRGSDAWSRAMREFGNQENDAYNQLLLQGRGQASQELLTEDNQRINQISALLSGGQVSQPNFMGANMPTIPTTDVAGIIGNYDAQRAANARARNAGLGSAISGLGGLFALSDERAKKDKKRVGKTDDGMGIYTYRYKGESDDAPVHMGLMAQEVAKKKPHAVAKRPDGMMAVNYEAAL